jgi:8-oxo-dGTP diphosphatase
MEKICGIVSKQEYRSYKITSSANICAICGKYYSNNFNSNPCIKYCMKKFNVRVYGLYTTGNKVMVCEETIRGQQIIKFPGGGLEYGEGTIECLKREFMEEMQIEVEILSHYYTTDYFQPSAYDDSQVISIYYMVRPLKSLILPFKNVREHFYLAEINEDLLQMTSLPIDKLVVRKMLKYI